MITVYLDTSDLSYLVKRQGPGGPDQWIAYRHRLEVLLRAGRVLLAVSPLHVYEMSVNGHTAQAAMDAIDSGLPIALIVTEPDEIFRAELEGRKPALAAGPLTRERLAILGTLVDSVGAGGLLGPGTAGLHAKLKQVEALGRESRDAESKVPKGVQKGAHRAALRRGRKLAERYARGDMTGVPPAARERMAEAVAHLEPLGLTTDDVANSMQLEEQGCGWIPSLKSPVALSEALACAADPTRAPACAMRIAVALAQRRRLPKASDRIDALHLAYATQCAFATIDDDNMCATAATRSKVATRFFQCGHLGALLDVLEAASAEAPT